MSIASVVYLCIVIPIGMLDLILYLIRAWLLYFDMELSHLIRNREWRYFDFVFVFVFFDILYSIILLCHKLCYVKTKEI